MANSKKILIDFVIFLQNTGVVDLISNLHYNNMLFAQIYVVYSTLSSLGDQNEVGTTPENAKKYNVYGTECWAVKSQHENKLSVAEMRMLRWMSGKTRKDKIRNVTIREGVGVAPITEKMVESRLRWFGHVWRRPVDAVVRRVDHMEGSLVVRGRGRPRKTIGETIKKDLEANGFTIDMIHDRPL
ncbi:hypothetical protein LguiB_015026 [Lonicera macranthoides]